VDSPVPADLLPEELSVVALLSDVSPGTSSGMLLRRPDILEAESFSRPPTPISEPPERRFSPASR